MRHRKHLAVLLIPAALGACQGADGGPPAADPAAGLVSAEAGAPGNLVQFTGLDYAFDGPIQLPAGLTTIRFRNEGSEAHHLTILRLAEGRTVEDVMTAMREQRPLVGIATAVGGPNAPMPGAETNATVDLEPGEYAILCVIPSPDGVPHMMKGMVRGLTVTGEAPAPGEVVAAAEVDLSDYAFQVDGDLTAGRRTIRVTNGESATEPHELVLVRLAPGQSAESVNDWIHSMAGPPPGEFIGGVTALDPGQSNTFTVDLTPGEYALLCPLPGVADGEPHTYKGMMHQFTVS